MQTFDIGRGQLLVFAGRDRRASAVGAAASEQSRRRAIAAAHAAAASGADAASVFHRRCAMRAAIAAVRGLTGVNAAGADRRIVI